VALTNATFPYVFTLANRGYIHAAHENPAVAAGLNVVQGKVVYARLAELFQQPLATLGEAFL
jgi:alanine dehydrogenase